MREIKAPRAWYKPLGIMIQPEEVESINFETKVIGVYMQMDGKGFHRLRLSDFEVMWPTGLKDHNGQEIYEGDIVRFKADPPFTFDYVREVEYVDAFFATKNQENKRYDLLSKHSMSVSYIIGNHWEHPHLLKEG